MLSNCANFQLSAGCHRGSSHDADLVHLSRCGLPLKVDFRNKVKLRGFISNRYIVFNYELEQV